MFHRIIYMVGHQCDIPDGYDVHHINGNRIDNRLCNLEIIKKSEHLSLTFKGKPKTEDHKKKISNSMKKLNK